jgi:hypothetical protein
MSLDLAVLVVGRKNRPAVVAGPAWSPGAPCYMALRLVLSSRAKRAFLRGVGILGSSDERALMIQIGRYRGQDAAKSHRP